MTSKDLSTSDDSRKDPLLALMRRLPGYTPEWPPTPGPVAVALLRAFANQMRHLQAGIEQLPARQELTFLDMVGTHLLPATAARAPVVFRLMEDSPVDVPLAAGSLVAAVPQPVLPSLLSGTATSVSAPEPLLFATERSFVLCRARLTTLYSIDPRSDEYTGHSALLEQGFTLFDDLKLTEHAIYLGHDRLFKIGGDDITLLLQITFATPVKSELKIAWQYLTDQGWISLEQLEREDTTRGLRGDGQIALRRACGPDAKKETFFGRTSYWVRGILQSPLLREQTAGQRTLPVFNDLRVRVKFRKENLLPEAAFADVVSLDVSKDFYPFGRQPELTSTFYVASKEVFQRAGAHVQLKFDLFQAGGPQNNLSLAWEYFDGGGWGALSIEPAASEVKFNRADKKEAISFLCPPDWQQTKVNGADNYWLRVRITEGNYGEPIRMDNSNPPALLPGNLAPPVISRLTLGYSYLTDTETLDHCLVRNDFVFEDQTEGCRWPDQTFTPFQPVSDEQPAVHFGFDRPLPSGLVSLYIDVVETIETSNSSSSPYIWEYRTADGWAELSVLDETQGFSRSGMIQFIGAPDAVAVPGLGGDLYRIRARMKQGAQVTAVRLRGVWFNAVWMYHREHYEQEWLGAGDGNPRQTLQTRHQPVLKDEVLEVQEWSGQGEGWKLVKNEVPETDLHFDRDPATQRIIGVWVRWRERTHLYDAAPASRGFVLERATGLVQFGDGRRGMIPPAGSRIRLSYDSGGGIAGSVPAGKITELRMVAPYVMSASNPVAASGGANMETITSIQQRGSQRLRHRDRAIAVPDIEWVARDASPEVARVLCLPLLGPAGHAQRGWITLIVVPRSLEARPQLQPELQRSVMAHVSARVPTALAGRVRVLSPDYVPLSIKAELAPLYPGEADQVEAQIRTRLADFLHPLRGGSDGMGWGFGQGVYKSQIAALIEGTPGVDYVRNLTLLSGERLFDEYVPVAAYALVCSAAHELKLITGER